jgi:hypothetical protein
MGAELVLGYMAGVTDLITLATNVEVINFGHERQQLFIPIRRYDFTAWDEAN